MTEKELINEIIHRLIGSTTSFGSEHEDTKVLKNLETVESIIWYLLDDIMLNSTHVDSKQASVHAIASKSYKMLLSMKESIDDAIKEAKQKMVDNEYHAPKIKMVDSAPKVYKVNEIDTVLSPFNIDYTLEWYNKLYDDTVTIDNIKEVQLFLDYGDIIKPKYDAEDKEVLYWEQSTPEEVKYLGTNVEIHPNPSKLGVIKNIYGDIYTQSNFYQAVEKYKDITEPFILCSTEF